MKTLTRWCAPQKAPCQRANLTRVSAKSCTRLWTVQLRSDTRTDGSTSQNTNPNMRWLKVQAVVIISVVCWSFLLGLDFSHQTNGRKLISEQTFGRSWSCSPNRLSSAPMPSPRPPPRLDLPWPKNKCTVETWKKTFLKENAFSWKKSLYQWIIVVNHSTCIQVAASTASGVTDSCSYHRAQSVQRKSELSCYLPSLRGDHDTSILNTFHILFSIVFLWQLSSKFPHLPWSF